jgi:hypothetical protein
MQSTESLILYSPRQLYQEISGGKRVQPSSSLADATDEVYENMPRTAPTKKKKKTLLVFTRSQW